MVFLVGVFLVSVLETHKTAGACVNLARRLDDIRDGRYDTTLRLRRDDHLVELEPVFNRMARAMQQRTWEEIEALEDLASRIERADPALDPAGIAVEIRGIAGRKRALLE
jgi:signal transduction histidine kinase